MNFQTNVFVCDFDAVGNVMNQRAPGQLAWHASS